MEIITITFTQEEMDRFDIEFYGSLEEAEKQKKAEAKLWCKGHKLDYGSRYIPDNQSKVCDKHHWICNKCNKITQIG